MAPPVWPFRAKKTNPTAVDLASSRVMYHATRRLAWNPLVGPTADRLPEKEQVIDGLLDNASRQCPEAIEEAYDDGHL